MGPPENVPAPTSAATPTPAAWALRAVGVLAVAMLAASALVWLGVPLRALPVPFLVGLVFGAARRGAQGPAMLGILVVLAYCVFVVDPDPSTRDGVVDSVRDLFAPIFEGS